MVMLLFALSGCGQKGDLYLSNIPPAPDVSSRSGFENGSALSDEQVLQSQVVSDENLNENEESETTQAKLLESPMTSEPE